MFSFFLFCLLFAAQSVNIHRLRVDAPTRIHFGRTAIFFFCSLMVALGCVHASFFLCYRAHHRSRTFQRKNQKKQERQQQQTTTKKSDIKTISISRQGRVTLNFEMNMKTQKWRFNQPRERESESKTFINSRPHHHNNSKSINNSELTQTRAHTSRNSI